MPRNERKHTTYYTLENAEGCGGNGSTVYVPLNSPALQGNRDFVGIYRPVFPRTEYDMYQYNRAKDMINTVTQNRANVAKMFGYTING
jgi:hypothetical protein